MLKMGNGKMKMGPGCLVLAITETPKAGCVYSSQDGQFHVGTWHPAWKERIKEQGDDGTGRSTSHHEMVLNASMRQMKYTNSKNNTHIMNKMNE